MTGAFANLFLWVSLALMCSLDSTQEVNIHFRRLNFDRLVKYGERDVSLFSAPESGEKMYDENRNEKEYKKKKIKKLEEIKPMD